MPDESRSVSCGHHRISVPDDRVVLFDGVCRLCNGWSRFLVRRNRARRLKLCSVQSPEGQAILAWFGFPTDRYETMIYVEAGRAYVRTDGILRVLGQLPRPWPWLSVLYAVPGPARGLAHVGTSGRCLRRPHRGGASAQ